MADNKFDLPAPYLREIYLKDDFDMDDSGSALATRAPDFHADADRAYEKDTLQTDDEFLESLLTPLESHPQESSQPAEADSNAAKNATRLKKSESQKTKRKNRFPFNLPWIENLHVPFESAVTFFVGENGTGKSTLIEAIAALSRFPVGGGGTNELAEQIGPEADSELASALISHFGKRHRDGYFFRAEFYADFASLLDERKLDPDFRGDPYQRYGGQSLHTRSHGESFLALLQNRFGEGLFLMDEPESALSPQRQLTLLAMIADRVRNGKSQFIIATHSPILMTFPGARIINFDSSRLDEIPFEDTSHYHLTRGILENPAMYWKHLAQIPGELPRE
ncbi:MAG: AAA family ATPase [Planctomycetota bacterium]